MQSKGFLASLNESKKGNGYYLYVYCFRTGSWIWDADCLIRFSGATKQVEAWQLNSD
jgi:hypothetical protein